MKEPANLLAHDWDTSKYISLTPISSLMKKKQPKKLSIWCDNCGKLREIVYEINKSRICNRCIQELQVVE